MLALSPVKLLMVATVIMLLLGPDKLPEVAHKLGASWRALKKLQEKMESEVREAIPDLPSTSEIARIARSPVSLLNQLADRVEATETPRVTPLGPFAPPSTANAPSARMTPPACVETSPPDPNLN